MQIKALRILKEISLKILVVSVLFILAIGIFAFIAHEAVLEKEDIFDSKVFAFFEQYSSEGFISFMKFITFFGSSYFLFTAYVILILFLIISKKRTEAINVSIVGVTSTLLMHGLKALFRRSRPDLPLFNSLHNYSFPSGHALSSFIFCSVLIYLLWQTRWKKVWKWLLSVVLILFSLCIGISRIVLRYHYASDVLAGFSLGLGWVIFSLWIQHYIKKRNERKAAVLSSEQV
jgi:membrane-associated phospholipid phosphatase